MNQSERGALGVLFWLVVGIGFALWVFWGGMLFASGNYKAPPIRRVLALHEAVRYLPAPQEGMRWVVVCSVEPSHPMLPVGTEAHCRFEEQTETADIGMWVGTAEAHDAEDQDTKGE